MYLIKSVIVSCLEVWFPWAQSFYCFIMTSFAAFVLRCVKPQRASLASAGLIYNSGFNLISSFCSSYVILRFIWWCHGTRDLFIIYMFIFQQISAMRPRCLFLLCQGLSSSELSKNLSFLVSSHTHKKCNTLHLEHFTLTNLP